jgi:hypothetical protein
VVQALILYILIIFAGTAGEMCMSRAMKIVGEVTDFRPHAIAVSIGRAMKLPWFWTGLVGMALAFFSLLAILSVAKASFVFPATALSYAVGTLGGNAPALVGSSAGLYRRCTGRHRQGMTGEFAGTVAKG